MDKLELRTFINSVNVLSKLARQDLPLRLAYKLRKIIEAVNKELEFFSEQRNKLMEGIEWENATLEEKNLANEKIEKLLAFEVEWETEPLVLPIDIEINLSASDLELAKEFIQIKEE